MRIGLVVEQFDPRRGGLEQWTWQFVSRLLGRGHEVHVVSAGFGDEVRESPIIRHRLEGADSRLGFARAAEKALKSMDLDVIHDTGCGWYCDVFQPHGGSRRAAIEANLRLLPRWMRPVKRAISPILPRYRRFHALAERQYVDDGRVVLALSQKVADDLVLLDGVRPERIRLVPNGVDTERFSPEHRDEHRQSVRRRLGVDEGRLLLLIIAHNFRLKGVPTLLEMMGRSKRLDLPVHLAVVGGKHWQRFQRKAGRTGIGSEVTFVGPVDDPIPFYAAADVYVQPTFYDPCSLTVLEAMASGLPVITTRVNGASELMSDGVEGHAMDDPADVAALLAHVQQLLDPTVRRQMGRSARRLMLQHTLDHNCDRIEAVYGEVVQLRRKIGRGRRVA
jgi:UDP-glucose:(heptosyl)LPS alpha-1,3-glucosyltransferase